MTVLLEHIDLQVYYGGATSYAPLSASYELVTDQCIVATAEIKTPRSLFELTENHNQKFINHSSMFSKHHQYLANIIDV